MTEHEIEVLKDAYSALMHALLDVEWIPCKRDKMALFKMRNFLRKHGVEFEQDRELGEGGMLVSMQLADERTEQ